MQANQKCQYEKLTNHHIYVSQMRENMRYLSFGGWFNMLNVIISSCIHYHISSIISYFWQKIIPVVDTMFSISIHLLLDIQVCSTTIEKSAAKNKNIWEFSVICRLEVFWVNTEKWYSLITWQIYFQFSLGTSKMPQLVYIPWSICHIFTGHLFFILWGLGFLGCCLF